MKLLILFAAMLSSNAFALIRDCSTYPLITYAERAIIKKAVVQESKPSPLWRKLTTKQRIELCRELAKTLRNLK